MKHPEYTLQKQCVQWLSYQYPDVLFLSDTVANIKLTIPQQVRNSAIQKKGFKCPDVIILEPNKEYNGLLIELKAKSPYKKNGEIYKNDHLQGQQQSIDELNSKGYKALFCWSFEDFKKIIFNYLK